MYLRVDIPSLSGAILYSNPTRFQVDTIAVSGVTPTEGPLVGKNMLQIDGSGLSGVSEVEFVSTAVPRAGQQPFTVTIPVTPTSDTRIDVAAPDDTAQANGSPAKFVYDIVALENTKTGPVESGKTAADRYSYELPTVTSVSAGTVAIAAAGGTRILVTGKYLEGVTTVLLVNNGHSTEVPAAVTSPDSLSFSTPNLTGDLSAAGVSTLTYSVIAVIPVAGTSFGNDVRSVGTTTLTIHS
jgi:hypothetical protein